MENAHIIGFRKPSRRKFVPRPLTTKLEDLLRYKKALLFRRPSEEALQAALSENVEEEVKI